MVEVVFLARVNNKERDPPRGPQHEEHAEQNITYQTEARDVGGGPGCRGRCQYPAAEDPALGTATNSAATKTAGGSQAHFCVATKLLSRLTPTAISRIPMKHLIKRSGSRAGTPPKFRSTTPQSFEQTDTSICNILRRVTDPRGRCAVPPRHPHRMLPSRT